MVLTWNQFLFSEISNMQTKEQKDTSNTCRKCIDLVSKVAKVGSFSTKPIPNIFEVLDAHGFNFHITDGY